MAKIESILKSEIIRLAKHEVRSVFRPLKKEVWGMKSKLSNLIKNFTVLDRLAKEVVKTKGRAKLEASPEEVRVSRLTAERISALRKKLGISQREMGILVGATIAAVASWEKGKFKPRGEKKAALVALRNMKKREVKNLLREKVVQEEPKAAETRIKVLKKKGDKRRPQRRTK